MRINVPLNLAHTSMLQHPISTDCNSDGIPISSRRNPETISKKRRPPQKNSTSRKIFTTLFPITLPSPTPFSYAPLSRLIARNLLAFTLTPTSFIMRYFYLFVFETRCFDIGKLQFCKFVLFFYFAPLNFFSVIDTLKSCYCIT